jgi:hypothetical protein
LICGFSFDGICIRRTTAWPRRTDDSLRGDCCHEKFLPEVDLEPGLGVAIARHPTSKISFL